MAYKQNTPPWKDKYTSHGLPEYLYTSSGKQISSANVDEGNLSSIDKKSGSVSVEDTTDKFEKGTRLFISKTAASEYQNRMRRIQGQMGG